jgi:hypothetical protein
MQDILVYLTTVTIYTLLAVLTLLYAARLTCLIVSSTTYLKMPFVFAATSKNKIFLSRVELEEIESNLGLRFHSRLDRSTTNDLCAVQVSVLSKFSITETPLK